MSRSELADAINEAMDRLYPRRSLAALYVDERWVGKLERGETRWPSVERRSALRLVFAVAGDIELGLYSPRHLDDPLVSSNLVDLESTRQTLTSMLSGQDPVGLSPEDWRLKVERHGADTRVRAASEILSDLSTDFHDLTRALQMRQSARATRQLTRVAAQMSGLIFLTLIKQNQPASARRWADTARLAADQSDDPDLLCWVRAQEAYVLFYSDRLPEALQLAVNAQEAAAHTPSVGLCLASALEGRVHAKLGADRLARLALDHAEHALDQLAASNQLPSAFGYNRAQLRFHQGNALTQLGDVDGARECIAQALNMYPKNDFLDRALTQLDQAQCHLHQHDLPAARSVLECALPAMRPEQRAGMVQTRARNLLTSLPPAEQQSAAGHCLRDLIAAA